MAASRAAIRYAKAALNLAVEKNLANAVETDMQNVFSVLTENKDLSSVLKSPVIKTEVKGNTIAKIFPDLNEVSKGLVNILLSNKRIEVLAEVAEKYIILNEQRNGKNKAIVTTAVPLTGDLEKKILEKVKELTGNAVTVENKIDKSIIGGFILRVGDLEYNASIANKLNGLKREFTSNTFVSKL